MLKPVSPKVDFPALERELLKRWYEQGIVQRYLHRNDASEKRFSFLDGPITANNPMGVHHAWGRTYKDLWQRFNTMRGYKERFQNGFDCQGLWVEVEVEKELGIRNKKDIENLVAGDSRASIAKFVQLCKERVLKFSAIQTEQTKRLGNFMDWEHSYYTMSDENNYMIWHFLKVCYEKGWIYKGRDSVPWCPRCETAISQHEMLTEDYKELTHETVFVKLPLEASSVEGLAPRGYLLPGSGASSFDNISLLVWTTTPWTVPANVAVGVNTKFLYGIWENEETKERIIFVDKDEQGQTPKRHHKGKELDVHEYLFHALESTWKKVGDISGKALVGLSYIAPFDHLPIAQNAKAENPETFHTVVDGSDIVMADEGTGLLHVAPGAGKEDFDLGKKEHLPIISPIKDDASYVDDMDEFSGKNAKKHPELIIDYLRNQENGKFLLKTLQYTHRYPACWRCKTELVWRVTDEWYIAMDKEESSEFRVQNSELKKGKTLREQMMETAKRIEWHPSFGLDRELDWLENMHDWLISKKNRYWGLALPIYECKKCGNFEIIGSKEELQQRAVVGWEAFEGHTPHKPFIDEVKIKCAQCDEVISRVDDVGNVWLDAGIVPFSTLVDPKTSKVSYTSDKTYWQEWFPIDFITESFPGQFKNWFYSMIAMSTVLEQKNPFKTILGYALMKDEKGEEMHKSKGNSIEFNEAADKFGVDVMRWMFARHDPEKNLQFGTNVANEVRRQFHLMLWNIYNFFLLNAELDGWKPTSPTSLRGGLKPDEAISKRPAQITNNEIASPAPELIRKDVEKGNVLDMWVTARLQETIHGVTEGLEKYKADVACACIESFVSELSLWYVRRSRDRVGVEVDNGSDKEAFYQTMYAVLVTLSKLLAPFTPFIADEMYTNLTDEESVHLVDWPLANENIKNKNEKLIQEMEMVRRITELGNGERKKLQIKVRQPLGKFQISNAKFQISNELQELIKDELNVKEVVLEEGEGELSVAFDTNITDELRAEGEVRDLIRKIQEERKKLGTRLDEKVHVVLEMWPEQFTEEIKRKALIEKLEKGDSFTVTRL